MAANDVSKNDAIEDLQTWNKFASSAKKAGFRDGAADGRDKVYQKSFDEGYMQGFSNGFAIGKYKGALLAKAENSETAKHDSCLENSRRGWCQICKDETLLQRTADEITHIQTQYSNNILDKLHSKYSPTTNVALQNKLV